MVFLVVGTGIVTRKKLLHLAILAGLAESVRLAKLQFMCVLPVGIEPTSYPPQGYILSIERWELTIFLLSTPTILSGSRL